MNHNDKPDTTLLRFCMIHYVKILQDVYTVSYTHLDVYKRQTKGHLQEAEIEKDPLLQFNKWFKQAQTELPKGSDIIPESTNFSTARLPSGRVSSRIVLLKELDHYGFVVYSNWGSSKKAADFNSNKHASLTFFWPHIQRQVRIEGLMEPVTRETTQRYFDTRPRGSKIGAWASPQSSVISSRDDLDKINNKYEDKFKALKDNEIPAPEHWGGCLLYTSRCV